jgi:MerR family transcriptional regulator, repressor of the yfmOP operon
VGAGVSDAAGDTAGAAQFRIGEVAQRAGVTTRTLRYYQELGLLSPSGASPGGSRRYSEADVNRLLRILELRNVMGFDLDRIATILDAEDRLAELREVVRRGVSREERQEILREAIALNHRMREQVLEKQNVLASFLGELDTKAARYREVATELGLDVENDAPAPAPAAAAPAG